jgi:hypothetical protein
MQVRRRFDLAWPALLLTMSAGALLSCQRDEAATSKAPPAQPTPPPLPLGAVPVTDDHVPDAGPPTGGDAIVATGEWSESRLYKFRLERIAPCGTPAQTVGPAQPRAAGAVSQFRGETSWVGAFFSVEAKDDVFVSPRDLHLRRGGVILNARHIDQPLLPACKPLLPAKQLRPGQSLAGFALFEVPKSFRTTTDDPIVLSYQPARWGGARKVEVPIRECLDSCPESLGKARKTAGRRAPDSQNRL